MGNEALLNIEFGDFKYIFKRIDDENNIDFSTLKIAMDKDLGFIDDYIFYEITSFLETELGCTCDAELVDVTDEEIERLVEFIKEIDFA